MTDSIDPPASDPEAPSAVGEPGASAPAKRRMPTGLKLAIGCIGVFFVFAALATVMLGVGGLWLKDKAGDFVEGVETRAEAQQQASTLLSRLDAEHPFSPPADGRIDPDAADRFLRATELAWVDIEPFARRMHEVAERERAGEARIGDVIEGARASSLLIDSRLHIARALDEVGMSLGEYTWTAGALREAWGRSRAVTRDSRGAGDAVMLANVELARRHSVALESMYANDDDANPSIVVGLAHAWSGAPGIGLDR